MQSDTILEAGTLIHQRYCVEGLIGKGGMGAVYRALDQRLKNTVALKQMLVDGNVPGAAFEREAQILARLRHPALPKVIDYFLDPQGHFLVMEFFDGADLETSLARNRAPFAVADVLSWADQILQALDYLHTQNPPVVHRDIKPQNLKLTANNRVVLLDFGLAKGTAALSEPSETSGSVFGFTPQYAPPEQIEGRGTEARSDLYALAATLYYLLSDTRPPAALTRIVARFNDQDDPLCPVHILNPQVPPAVNSVLMRALSLSINERPASAAHMLAELRATHQGVVTNDGSRPTIVLDPLPDTLNAPRAEPLLSSAVLQPTSLPISLERRNRLRMLDKVRTFWIEGVLEHSLHGVALIELGMEQQSDAVVYPWDMVVQRPDYQRSLPAGTHISSVFADLGKEMLILGAPGAGKTTMLLELTRVLLKTAEQDEAQPMPVVFNLSSWAEQRQPLAVWLVDELHTRYDVPQKVAHTWVDTDQVLPLLDGLDEVKSEWRTVCVEMINLFRKEHGFVGLVVCSRLDDYRLLSVRLRLQGAVVLQPLTPWQIDAYLSQAGDKLTTVRRLLQADEGLRELATTPLMLSIMTLAYRGMSSEALPAHVSPAQQRRHLFDTYIQRMFERRGTVQHYTHQQTRHWLVWLAGKMVQHSQTVFFIEGVQPGWLETHFQRWLYVVLAALVGSLAFALVGGLVGGIMGGLFLVITSVQGLLLGNGGISGLGALFFGLRVGIGMGMLTGLISGAIVGQTQLQIATTGRHTWGNAKATLAGAVGTLVGTTLIAAGFQVRFITGLLVGLFGGLLYGLVITVIVWLLMRQGRIQTVETLRWSWTRLQSGLGIGIRAGAGVGLAAGVLSILLSWIVGGLIGGIGGGIIGGLVLGVVGGLVGGTVSGLVSNEVETRTQPNEGIRRSAHSALLAWLTFGMSSMMGSGLVIGICVKWAFHALFGVDIKWATGLIFGLIFGLPLAPLLGLYFGGLAVVQHSVLRFIFMCSGCMPWNYVRFLNYTAERIFLRKVGGGYIFVHRLLLEHFAGLAPDASPSDHPS